VRIFGIVRIAGAQDLEWLGRMSFAFGFEER
jgi:hypothetical protein